MDDKLRTMDVDDVGSSNKVGAWPEGHCPSLLQKVGSWPEGRYQSLLQEGDTVGEPIRFFREYEELSWLWV